MVDGLPADTVPLSDRGGAYGHGLFETLLLHNRSIPLWQQHSRRLVADAQVLGIKVSPTRLQTNLDAFLGGLSGDQLRDGIIKIIVTAGSGGRGYSSPANMTPRIICQYFELPANVRQQRREGITLTSCHYRLPINPALAGIKHLNRLDQVMARAEWVDEFDDGIMFSTEGLAVETTRANLFLKGADGWITPVLDKAGVRGVMRALLLDELFASCGLAVRQTTLTREQVAEANELFVCSAVRGVVPVIAAIECGALAIGDDTRVLQTALHKHCDSFPC